MHAAIVLHNERHLGVVGWSRDCSRKLRSRPGCRGLLGPQRGGSFRRLKVSLSSQSWFKRSMTNTNWYNYFSSKHIYIFVSFYHSSTVASKTEMKFCSILVSGNLFQTAIKQMKTFLGRIPRPFFRFKVAWTSLTLKEFRSFGVACGDGSLI